MSTMECEVDVIRIPAETITNEIPDSEESPPQDDVDVNPPETDITEVTNEPDATENTATTDINETSSENDIVNIPSESVDVEIPLKADITGIVSETDIKPVSDIVENELKSSVTENQLQNDVTEITLKKDVIEITLTENPSINNITELPAETNIIEDLTTDNDININVTKDESKSDIVDQFVKEITENVIENVETERPNITDTTLTPPSEPFVLHVNFFANIRNHYEHYTLFSRMLTGNIPLAPNVVSKDQAELQASKRSHIINKLLDDVLARIDIKHPQFLRLTAMRCLMYYEDACILEYGGETALAKQILWRAIHGHVKHVLKPEMTYTMLRILNHLSYMVLREGNYGVPKDLMEQSEKIYLTLNCRRNGQEPAPLTYYTEWDLFADSVDLTTSSEGYEKSERLITHNIEMLSHIYFKENNPTMYSISQHRVLNRQLYMKDGDPLSWTKKCMSIAHFFMTRMQFSAARTHLAAATRILEEYVGEFHADASTTSNDMPVDLIERCEEIAKSWVTYALALFTESKAQILKTYYEEMLKTGKEQKKFVQNHIDSDQADELVARFRRLLRKIEADESINQFFQGGCGDDVAVEESEGSSEERRGQEEGVAGEAEIEEEEKAEGVVSEDKIKKESRVKEEGCNVEEVKKDGDEIVEKEIEKKMDSLLIKEEIKGDGDCIIATKEIKEELKEEVKKTDNDLNNGDVIVYLREDGVEVVKKGEELENDQKEDVDEQPETSVEMKEELDNEIEMTDTEDDIRTDDGDEEYVDVESSDDDTSTEMAGDDDDDDEEDSGTADEIKPMNIDPLDVIFQFKLLYLDDIIAEVPSELIDSQNDAHRLFNHAKNWLKRVISYNDLESNQMEYLNCVMDMSELYRLAAFYEDDPGSRFYLLRDRAHTLEIVTTVLQEVKSPSFVHIGVELLRELTEVRMEMLELSRPGRSGRRFLRRKMGSMRFLHGRIVDTAAALGRDELVTRFLKMDPLLLGGYEVPVGSDTPQPFQD